MRAQPRAVVPARVALALRDRYRDQLYARYEPAMNQWLDEHVDALRQILGIALQVMGFDRACLVAHVEGSDAAYVVAATDAPKATGIASRATLPAAS